MYRLVELNYKLGLIDEAKKYTALLGYNYQSSDWYERSYKILNRTNLIAVCDNKKDILLNFKKKWKVKSIYTDYIKMLKNDGFPHFK